MRIQDGSIVLLTALTRWLEGSHRDAIGMIQYRVTFPDFRYKPQGSLLVSPYMPRSGLTCFLDVVCVHQTDEDLMKQGIYNIGGVLAVSANLHVLWSPPYLSR